MVTKLSGGDLLTYAKDFKTVVSTFNIGRTNQVQVTRPEESLGSKTPISDLYNTEDQALHAVVENTIFLGDDNQVLQHLETAQGSGTLKIFAAPNFMDTGSGMQREKSRKSI
ncbi:14158_t:CDS:2 [Funneliformis caledonium]|uniref:14158_t:CDS:1 n=1 Tax=Funneliformis caledonium TaxID=1117310 RepID=A0A9N9E665_9GLOM|nr:14158_t:CDS:2 [Funneliformis caledonium]